MRAVCILQSLAILLCASTPVMGGYTGPIFTWYAGGVFVDPAGGGPAIAVNLTTQDDVTSYDASGLSVQNVETRGVPPRIDDKYQFSFNTGVSSFALIEDKTYESANDNSAAENIKSSSISNVQVETLDSGIMQLSFDTLYGANTLPADYQQALNSKAGDGHVVVQWDPTDGKNEITNVDVEITPEPATFTLLGSSFLLLGYRLLKGRRRALSDWKDW
jgi:hypothetical protein